MDKKVLLIEIIGLAGSGKTTLTRLLSQKNPNFQIGLHLSKIKAYSHLINPSILFLPTFVTSDWGDRWFDWRETKAIMFMYAWQRQLKRYIPQNIDVVLFDHGPIYWLTRLRAMGPEFTKSRPFERWWENQLLLWAMLLDCVIWLDAPDEILINRIQSREQDHIVKAESVGNIYKFLSGFRSAFDQSTNLVTTQKKTKIFSFYTDIMTPEQIADDVQAIVDTKLRFQKEIQ